MDKRLFVILAVIVLMASCTPISESNNDDPYSYYSDDGQILYLVNDNIDLYEETGDSGISTSLRAAGGQNVVTEDWGYTISRVAQVLPLEVDSADTQANNVLLSTNGKTAVISYNTAGEVFSGGLQILDMSDADVPELVKEIPLSGRDVNAMLLDGDTLYFGGMQDPGVSANNGYRSFVARIDLADIANVNESNALDVSNTTLPPWSVTGLAVEDSLLYVSVGAADGQLLALDPETLAVSSTIDADIDGIRDLAAYNKGIIALSGPVGTTEIQNGYLYDFRTQDSSQNTTLTIDGFGSEDHKATVEVYNNRYAFMGLSHNGLKVVDLKDVDDDTELTVNDYLFEISNPTATWSELTTTNSVSYYGDLIFSANGEYGFRVLQFQPDSSWAKKGEEFARVVGYVSFEDHPTEAGFWSANDIVYRINTMIVACGEGGVNVYKTIKTTP